MMATYSPGRGRYAVEARFLRPRSYTRVSSALDDCGLCWIRSALIVFLCVLAVGSRGREGRVTAAGFLPPQRLRNPPTALSLHPRCAERRADLRKSWRPRDHDHRALVLETFSSGDPILAMDHPIGTRSNDESTKRTAALQSTRKPDSLHDVARGGGSNVPPEPPHFLRSE